MAHQLTDEEVAALKGFRSVLTELLELRPNMPLHQAIVLVSVAIDEGHSQREYGDFLGFQQSMMSRAFLDCGPKTRKGEEGLGLIDLRRSMKSLRTYEIFLSIKGRALMKSIAKKLVRK
ncbi:MAG: hypothetical protein FWD68_20830 [Alphaproteobacteria bacterium]|nr:hypothetical protein [Alphaproteobacteria bacterium]